MAKSLRFGLTPSTNLLLTDQSEELKFNLSLKIEELDELSDLLSSLIVQPRKNQQKWMKQYGQDLIGLFDNYVDESIALLNGVQVSEGLMEESAKFTKKLQIVARQASAFFNEHQKIKA